MRPLKDIHEEMLGLWTSGSQPGVRVHPGICEKSLGVRQIFFTPKLLFNIAII